MLTLEIGPLGLPDSQGTVSKHKCIRCMNSFSIKHWCDEDDRSPSRSLFSHGKWYGPYCSPMCLTADWPRRWSDWNNANKS